MPYACRTRRRQRDGHTFMPTGFRARLRRDPRVIGDPSVDATRRLVSRDPGEGPGQAKLLQCSLTFKTEQT